MKRGRSSVIGILILILRRSDWYRKPIRRGHKVIMLANDS